MTESIKGKDRMIPGHLYTSLQVETVIIAALERHLRAGKVQFLGEQGNAIVMKY